MTGPFGPEQPPAQGSGATPWVPQQPFAAGPLEPVDPYGGQPAYPVPVSHQYVNPGSWEPAQYFGQAPGPGRDPVPGTIVGGSVVGYLLGLFLFVTGLFLMFFGTVLGGVEDFDTGVGDGGPALLFAGFGNWVATTLFVAGGVMVSLRRAAGLILTVAAAGVVAVLAVYWAVLDFDGTVVFWGFLHVAFAALCAGLVALPASNRAWLAGAGANGSSTALPPAGPPALPPPYPTDQYGRPFGS